MAEVVLQESLDRRFRMDTSMPVFVVSSAGLADGDPKIPDNDTNLPVSAAAADLLRYFYRVDLSKRLSRPVWSLPKNEQASIIIAVSPSVAEVLSREIPKAWGVWPESSARAPRILVMNEAGGGIPDPFFEEDSEEAYPRCLARIEAAVPDIVDQIGEIVRKENAEAMENFLSAVP
jgi:hypothetical protein